MIEQQIADLIAALNSNTAALIANAGKAPAPKTAEECYTPPVAAAEKPKAAKKEKPTPTSEPAPAPPATPEPAPATPEPAPATASLTLDTIRALAVSKHKQFPNCIPGIMSSAGLPKVSELTPDQFQAAFDALTAYVG